MSKLRNGESRLFYSFEEIGANQGRLLEDGSDHDDLYRVGRLFVNSDNYFELTDIAGLLKSVDVGND